MNTENEQQTNRTNAKSETTDTLNFINEIRPETINKLIFSEDLCKISFKILTHDTDVEILYNPMRNMFNATNLLKTSVSQLIRNGKFTVPDLERLKDPEKLSSYIRKLLYNELSSIRNIHYIDRLSMLWYGKYHYSYKGKSIWNKNDTIIDDLTNDHSNVIKEKLDEEKDNLIETVNAGKSPMSGTWLNYEFLPKILSLANEDYDILANHFQVMLLPQLTNKNMSLEEHVKHQQRVSLLSQLRINNIKTIQKANDKGKEAEKLVLESMQEVFPTAKKVNRYHSCDIEAENGEILVEVKADFDKFISDLIEHQETVHIGLYINIFDTKHKTHYIITEYGFTVWFINPSDFTHELLNIIKQSNKEYNKEIMIKRKANQQAKQIIFVKEIQEELLDRLEKRWELHERALIARHNMNTFNNKTMFMVDAKSKDKQNRDIQRERDLPKFNELVKSFIKLHYIDFKNGYHTKTCRTEIDEYIRNNGITSMGFDIIQNTLNSYVHIDRHPTIPNGHHCYFFISGLGEQFKPDYEQNEKQTLQLNDGENNIGGNDSEQIKSNNQQIPSMKETFDLFINKPNIREMLIAKGGFKQEHISKRFKYHVQTQICNKDKTISHKRYTDEFSKYINEICIQVNKSGKRYYILKGTDEANNILKLFDDCVNHELSRDKNISYNEMKNIYQDTVQSNTLLTKLTMQPRFIQLKEEFSQSNK